MNLEYTPAEKTQIILLNISKMLKERRLIKDYNDFYTNIKKIGDSTLETFMKQINKT